MGTCTHIRTLVLQTPSLWCFVDIEQPRKWIYLCLQRSMNHPLQTYLGLDSEDGANSATALLTRSSAAWIVRLHSAERLRPLLQTAAPALKFLQSGSHGGDRARWDLDDSFLANRCTNLIRLEVARANLHALPYLPKLIYLNISDSILPENQSHFAFHLAQCVPRLRTLHNSSLSVRNPSGRIASNATVPCALPCLEQMHLQGTVHAIWLILRELPEPQRCLELSVCRTRQVLPEGLKEEVLKTEIMIYAQQFWR
jgi:hypothetical protein